VDAVYPGKTWPSCLKSIKKRALLFSNGEKSSKNFSLSVCSLSPMYGVESLAAREKTVSQEGDLPQVFKERSLPLKITRSPPKMDAGADLRRLSRF
jgi:hypothetical protein